MTGVHVVLPGDVDDPARTSGGNVYDRRVCDELSTDLLFSARTEHNNNSFLYRNLDASYALTGMTDRDGCVRERGPWTTVDVDKPGTYTLTSKLTLPTETAGTGCS